MEKNDEILENSFEAPLLPEENNMSAGRKLALSGLIVFAVGIFVLWGFEMRNNIFQPQSFKDDITAAENESATVEQCADGSCSQTDADLNKDTDSDGLSDYDELNNYSTSPYLADTDSDGISDDLEIKSNTDPNCPQGRNCSLSSSLVSGVSSDTSTSSEEIYDGVSSEEDIIKANADIIRQALLDSGEFDEETLNNISDSDLLAIYQMVAEEAELTQDGNTE